MTPPIPTSVALGPSPQLLRRTRAITVCITLFMILVMTLMPSWIPLTLIPFACAQWLYNVRLESSRMEFTAECVRVWAILRWTRIPIECVTQIVLSNRPGVASVIADDGGTAVVTMSANGVESHAERRVRVHEAEMLRRMYGEGSIPIHSSDDTHWAGVNRSSAVVSFQYIHGTWRELAIVLVIVVVGIICVLL